MSMGYRGEDVSRDRADSRRQQPWQQSSGTRPAAEEQWSEAPRGYGQVNDGYSTGHDYAPDGGYASGDEYASDGYASGGYGGADAYAGYESYGQGDGYGYSGDGYGQGNGYGSGGQYGSDGKYEYGHGHGYGEQGYGQGATGYNDGDDWYGSQAPVTGGFAAVRDPVRGFPPTPGQFVSRPQLPPATPQLEAAPHTGQHEVYDESRYGVHTGQHEVYDTNRYGVHTGQHEVYDDNRYEAYPGYEGVTEAEEPQGYGAPQGYDSPGYNSTQAYDTGGYDTSAYDTGGYDTSGYDTGGYDTDQAEPQLFAAAPTYEDAVDYAPQDYDDYDDGTLGGGRPGKTRKGRKGRVLLTASGIFLLVAAAAGAGYTFVLKPKQSVNNNSATGPLPSTGATSSAAACSAKLQTQLGTYCHIELRSDDPQPLTLAELYPPQFFNEADHTSFTQVGTRLDKNCANAVIGPDLVSALQSGKCTQALRASYVSGDHKIMGTVGVVNLNTTNEAHHAGKLVGANDFISPLSAAHGLGKTIGQGTGVVQAEFKGHYLILTWAEFSNLKAPANTTQDNELLQFQNDLIAETVDISLSQRMVNGKPDTASGA